MGQEEKPKRKFEYPTMELDLTAADWALVKKMRAVVTVKDAELLKDDHSPEQLAKCGGEAGMMIRWEIVKSYTSNLTLRVGTMAKCRLLAAALAGPNPSALESLLAEAAVTAWVDVQRCHAHHETGSEGVPIRVADYLDRRVDRAHKRFVRTLRALAAVRKVDVTSIHVNIANVVESKLRPFLATMATADSSAPGHDISHRPDGRKPLPSNADQVVDRRYAIAYNSI
jgi:hypothetical protein